MQHTIKKNAAWLRFIEQQVPSMSIAAQPLLQMIDGLPHFRIIGNQSKQTVDTI